MLRPAGRETRSHTHAHTLTFASLTGYLKWHHITLVQVQEEVEVGHSEGKVLQGLLVVVHSQLLEVLGGWGERV